MPVCAPVSHLPLGWAGLQMGSALARNYTRLVKETAQAFKQINSHAQVGGAGRGARWWWELCVWGGSSWAQRVSSNAPRRTYIIRQERLAMQRHVMSHAACGTPYTYILPAAGRGRPPGCARRLAAVPPPHQWRPQCLQVASAPSASSPLFAAPQPCAQLGTLISLCAMHACTCPAADICGCAVGGLWKRRPGL